MGIKSTRKKDKNILLSIIYRLQKFLPLRNTTKFKLFLNLEWIFDRLAHEQSFKFYTPGNHPVRQFSKVFILDNIEETSTVLDLGCNLGDISFIIAEKAKEVVGIDYNKNAIEIAKQRHKRHNLKFYNREALEFLKENSKHFDILILSHILEHLDNPKEFLLDFKDYFKQIYIELPDFDRYYLNHYRKDLNLNLIYSDDDHISEFDRNELRTLLNECNIKILKEEYEFGVQKLWCKV
jgi:SAM-dependent methyltransferase